jgi:hypothetical protein
MKRHTVVLPLLLPRLSDRAAAQLIDLLHALLAAVEHHYAEQAWRYNKRRCPLTTTDDPPF